MDGGKTKRFADGLYAVLEQVRKNACRCRALDICFPGMMLVVPIVDEINRNDTLLLEELRIETDRLLEASATLPSTTHVPALPQLRILEFKTRTPSIPYFKAPVAGLVSALRNVSIFQRLSWDDFYAWVKACPRIEEACFEVYADANRNASKMRGSYVVSPERLTLLQLSVHAAPVTGDISELLLDVFHLPALDTLELRFPDARLPGDNSDTLANLTYMLQKSRPPLKNLLFRNILTPLERIVSVLEEASLVETQETLDADKNVITEDPLRLLSVSQTSKPSAAEISIKPRLLPDLRVLQVDGYFRNPPDVAAEFIRSRWDTSGVVSQPIEDRNQNNANDEEEETYVQPPKRQFLEVCISTPHHTGLAENETVMRCIEEGFSFSLLSPGPSSLA